MKEKKELRTGVRVALQIVCVVMASLTLLQAAAFLAMADFGFYHETLEQLENDKVTQRIARPLREITESYVYHDKQTAYEMTQNLYDTETMSFVIKKNGKDYIKIGSFNADMKAGKAWEVDYYMVALEQDGAKSSVWMEDEQEAESFCNDNTNAADIYQISGYTYLSQKGAAGSVLGVTLRLMRSAYGYRYTIIWGFFVTTAAALALFILLAVKDNRKSCLVDQLPFDLYLIVCYGVAAVVLLAAGMGCIENMFFSDYVVYDAAVIYLLEAGVVVCSVIISALTLQLFLSIVRRIKNKSLWKSTVIYRIWHWISLQIKRVFDYGAKNLPLIWKGLLVYAGICLLQLIWMLIWCDSFCYDGGIMLLTILVWQAVLLVPYSLLLIQAKKLLESGEKLAEGDLSHKTDTGHLYGDLKKHGENLNSIGVGIQNAVEERMKSEHFKTELITNVSHDIKTPLTSIINYVDLLEKEELDNPKVTEYLEVLSRQSARLKKLIEDLIEASKASTGALAVHLEECEVGVLLTQAAGEFEEKLKAQELTLLLKKPETEFVIRADGRHLWRVFDNLLNNIYKYAQPQTRVYLNMEQKGEFVEIVFRNTSRYELNLTGEELRERFVRGDSSRSTEGNGLGLSIAQSLTELMGGTFELVIDGDLFKVILAFPLVKTLF